MTFKIFDVNELYQKFVQYIDERYNNKLICDESTAKEILTDVYYEIKTWFNGESDFCYCNREFDLNDSIILVGIFEGAYRKMNTFEKISISNSQNNSSQIIDWRLTTRNIFDDAGYMDFAFSASLH